MVVFDEPVNDCFQTTQDVLKQDQLDTWNLILYVTSWYEGLANLYNDPDFVAEQHYHY